MIRPITVIKTAAIAVSMIVVTPVIHTLLGLVVSQEASITGAPHVPLLLGVVSVQATLMVVVFNLVKDEIPTPQGYNPLPMSTRIDGCDLGKATACFVVGHLDDAGELLRGYFESMVHNTVALLARNRVDSYAFRLGRDSR